MRPSKGERVGDFRAAKWTQVSSKDFVLFGVMLSARLVFNLASLKVLLGGRV